MQPYVIENKRLLAESEQQTAQRVFDTFSVGKPFAIFVGMRSFHSLSLRYVVGRLWRLKSICFTKNGLIL